MSDATSELRAAAENFVRALGALDWERFVACWSADPTAFFPGDAVWLDGRAAVLGRFRTMFDRFRSSGPGTLPLNPRDLRVDLYGAAGLVTFTLMDIPGPTPLRSLLFVREDGVWKLAHVHATNTVSV